MTNWDLNVLADDLASSCDIDIDAARRSAEVYLEQIEDSHGRVIDRNNIPEDDVVTVRTAVMNGLFALSTAAQVDALAEASEGVAAARRVLDARTHERTVLVRKALAAGVPIPFVIDASGLSRARIYQIKDGK